MFSIILQLEGGLRSWGESSLGDHRSTLNHPTKSAVLGLLAACCGIDKDDSVRMPVWLKAFDVSAISTIKFKDGKKEISSGYLHDYQATRGSLTMNGSENPFPIVSERIYMVDQHDSVLIECKMITSRELRKFLLKGMKNPVFTPYLGRKSNSFGGDLISTIQDCSEMGRGESIEALISSHKSFLDSKNLHAIQSNLITTEFMATSWLEYRMMNSMKIPHLEIKHINDSRNGSRKTYSRRKIVSANISF